MADDFYTSGLNGRDIAILAQRYRDKFDIVDQECTDIINVLEFKLPQAFPEFNLIEVQDDELDDYARTVFEPLCIVVRQSVYDDASRGSAFSRMILAHELGHLIMHREHKNRLPAAALRKDAYTENVKNLNGKESAEAQATQFARVFLLPIKMAFAHRNNLDSLAQRAGIPKIDASSVVNLSRRQEMYDLAK